MGTTSELGKKHMAGVLWGSKGQTLYQRKLDETDHDEGSASYLSPDFRTSSYHTEKVGLSLVQRPSSSSLFSNETYLF